MTDEILAESTRQGNGTAFAALVARHGDAVYRIAMNMCPSNADAGEVTRETFLSACRDAGSRPGHASFRTWLYGIAVKKASVRQQTSGRQAIPLEVFLPRFDADGGLEPSGEWPEPGSARLEQMDLSGFLRRALDGMDEGARTAFVLCDLVQLPPEEAAAIVDAPPEMVRRRVHRARLMLRGFLDRLWSV